MFNGHATDNIAKYHLHMNKFVIFMNIGYRDSVLLIIRRLGYW